MNSRVQIELPELVAVALIDAAQCAATGGMSVSWWYEAVRNGIAPQPAIRRGRCTRWRLKDISEFWRCYAEAADPLAAAAVIEKATKASAAAGKKRKALEPAGAAA